MLTHSDFSDSSLLAQLPGCRLSERGSRSSRNRRWRPSTRPMRRCRGTSLRQRECAVARSQWVGRCGAPPLAWSTAAARRDSKECRCSCRSRAWGRGPCVWPGVVHDFLRRRCIRLQAAWSGREMNVMPSLNCQLLRSTGSSPWLCSSTYSSLSSSEIGLYMISLMTTVCWNGAVFAWSRWLRKMIPLRAAVRGAAKRVSVRLRSVMQRVEHAVALGVEQPDRAPIGRELEAKRGFRHCKGFAPGQLRALGEGVFFLADRVGEVAPDKSISVAE